MTEYVYKLKNGKLVSAYADEKGNISITKEALEIMVNSWNVGYQKGFSDGCLKGRADAIEEIATRLEAELLMIMPRDNVKFIMYKVHTVLEQLKKLKGAENEHTK